MIANDWQLAGIWTAATGSAYAIGYSYNNGGGNVNLTGSPDYGGRIRIVGDTGNGCSDDVYSQFNVAAFQGPLPGSVGLESGNNYLKGCFQSALDLSLQRTINLGGGRAIQLRADVFNAFNEARITGRNTDRQLRQPERSGHRDQPAVRRQWQPGRVAVVAAWRRVRRRERVPGPASGAAADSLQVLMEMTAQGRMVNCVPQWRGSPGRPVIAGIGTFAVPVMYHSWFPRLRPYTAIFRQVPSGRRLGQCWPVFGAIGPRGRIPPRDSTSGRCAADK